MINKKPNLKNISELSMFLSNCTAFYFTFGYELFLKYSITFIISYIILLFVILFLIYMIYDLDK
jgi:hypothetical protein